jgi:DNA-binding LytR/AlgR family response regulator
MITEDDFILRRVLQAKVRASAADVYVCAVASTMQDAVRMMDEHKPDIVVSDISLPGGTGFDALNAAQHKPIALIFLSAHESYRADAAKFGAVDYISKERIEEDLLPAIARAYERVMYHRAAEAYNALIAASLVAVASPSADNTSLSTAATSTASSPESGHLHTGINDALSEVMLCSPITGETVRVSATHIIALAADQDWSRVHCIGVDSELGDTRRLSTWDKLFIPPPRTDAKGNALAHTLEDSVFMRVHRSWMVNLLHVTSIARRGKDITATMSNGTEIPISRGLKATFEHRWRDAEQHKRLHHDAFLRKYGRK